MEVITTTAFKATHLKMKVDKMCVIGFFLKVRYFGDQKTKKTKKLCIISIRKLTCFKDGSKHAAKLTPADKKSTKVRQQI